MLDRSLFGRGFSFLDPFADLRSFIGVVAFFRGRPTPPSGGTNLAAAVNLAYSLFQAPGGTSGCQRILVIISDGTSTVDTTEYAAFAIAPLFHSLMLVLWCVLLDSVSPLVTHLNAQFAVNKPRVFAYAQVLSISPLCAFLAKLPPRVCMCLISRFNGCVCVRVL